MRGGNGLEGGGEGLLPGELDAEVLARGEEHHVQKGVAHRVEGDGARLLHHLVEAAPVVDQQRVVHPHARAVAVRHLELVVARHVDVHEAAPHHDELAVHVAGDAGPRRALLRQRVVDRLVYRVHHQRQDVQRDHLQPARHARVAHSVEPRRQAGQRRATGGDVQRGGGQAQWARGRDSEVRVHRAAAGAADHAGEGVDAQARGQGGRHGEHGDEGAGEPRAVGLHRTAQDGGDVVGDHEGGCLAAHEGHHLVHRGLGQARLHGAVAEAEARAALAVGVVEAHEVTAGGEEDGRGERLHRGPLRGGVQQRRVGLVEEQSGAAGGGEREVVGGRHADVDEARDRRGEGVLDRVVQARPGVLLGAAVVVLQIQRLEGGTHGGWHVVEPRLGEHGAQVRLGDVAGAQALDVRFGRRYTSEEEEDATLEHEDDWIGVRPKLVRSRDLVGALLDRPVVRPRNHAGGGIEVQPGIQCRLNAVGGEECISGEANRNNGESHEDDLCGKASRYTGRGSDD